MTHRILIVVTHLLGTGHLSRALNLGREMTRSGIDVHVISGGMPVPHFDTTGMHFHQLPPLRSNGTDFSTLLDETGQPAQPGVYDARARQLCDLVTDLAPDMLITELFPFGRRNLRAEFIALLEKAHTLAPRPKILCSIRDILAPPSKAAKIEFARDLVERFYDGVLVHSDPEVVPLDLSWPVSPDLAQKLHYTGFVTSPLPSTQGTADGHAEVLVSAGGGQVGVKLFQLAAMAAQQDVRVWRLLIPNALDIGIIKAAAENPAKNLIFDKIRLDFRQMLQNSAASVSFCGYNTAMDLLQTGLPAVVIPFDEGGEVEQTLRADALSTLQALNTHTISTLSVADLLTSVDEVIKSGRRPVGDFDLNGAQKTVQICLRMLT